MSGSSKNRVTDGRSAIRVADQPQEVGHVRDVLERVPAADMVAFERPVSSARNDRATKVSRSAAADHGALRPVGRVDADAAAAAALAQRDQKLALAAADLDHRLACEPVRADLLVAEFVEKAAEPRREALGLLVVGGVVVQRRVEPAVLDEAAVPRRSPAPGLRAGMPTPPRASPRAGSCAPGSTSPGRSCAAPRRRRQGNEALRAHRRVSSSDWLGVAVKGGGSRQCVVNGRRPRVPGEHR